MQDESPLPYRPPSTEDATEFTSIDERGSNAGLVSFVGCFLAGTLFVAAMHFANFDGETIVLMIAGTILLLLSFAVAFMKLRVIAPMFVLFPFCIAVAIRHVGDMGPTHYIDGGLYLFTVFVFFCFWAVATMAKWGLSVYHR